MKSDRGVVVASVVIEVAGVLSFLFWLWAVVSGDERFIALHSMLAVLLVAVLVAAGGLWIVWHRLPGAAPPQPAQADDDRPRRVGVRCRVVPRGHLTYEVVDASTGDVIEEFDEESQAREFARGLEDAMNGVNGGRAS